MDGSSPQIQMMIFGEGGHKMVQEKKLSQAVIVSLFDHLSEHTPTSMAAANLSSLGKITDPGPSK